MFILNNSINYKKLFLIVIILTGLLLPAFSQRGNPVIFKTDSVLFFTNRLITGSIQTNFSGVGENKNVSINSIIFKTQLLDTAYRYSTNKLQKGALIDLGKTNTPGLYYIEIDTVTNHPARFQSADSIYNWYNIFVHPQNDSVCKCENLDRGSWQNNNNNAVFPPGLYLSLDSLINRINPDSINRKFDSLVMADNKDAHFCDSLKSRNIKFAFIISNSVEARYKVNSITVVIDSLHSNFNTAIDSKRYIDSAFAIFKNLVLDTSVNSLDSISISKMSKLLLSEALDSVCTNKKYNLVYSNGIIRELLMVKAHINVNFFCKKYLIYKNQEQFNQLIVLVNIPISP